MHRAAPWLVLLIAATWITACPSTDDDGFGNDPDDDAAGGGPADDDTGDDDVTDDDTGDDDTAAGTYALTSGTYTITIDELTADSCHASTGDGIHVHVGESQSMELTVHGAAIEGQDEQMSWEGQREGDTFVLHGTMDWDVGSTMGLDCVLQFTTAMDAAITADDAFDYDIHNVVDGQGADCGQLEEDDGGPYPLVPSFPCEHRWAGTGTRQSG